MAGQVQVSCRQIKEDATKEEHKEDMRIERSSIEYSSIGVVSADLINVARKRPGAASASALSHFQYK